jgi:hypothetical protein
MLIMCISPLIKDITPDSQVTSGQGEYIVFHSLAGNEKKEVEEDTYAKAYQVFNDYTPAAMAGRNAESDEYKARFETIKSKIQQIDKTLAIAFVPRTLYELIFLRKCIEEDLTHKSICKIHPLAADTAKNVEIRKERKCWHLCYFKDAGDNQNPKVLQVAYRLNSVVEKTLGRTENGYTFKELGRHTQNELEFFMNHFQQGYVLENPDVTSIFNCSTHSPTNNFGWEGNRGRMRPMGIRNAEDSTIIVNALAVDCSTVAQKAFILYRGSHFESDSLKGWDKEKPYSTSFGSSVFAGAIHDAGASAFHFMRNVNANAYAMAIPFEKLYTSPFYIPPTNTICQLFGDGEIFHARTKAWKGADLTTIGGMNFGVNGSNRDHLQSELPQEEMLAQFQEYKTQAIQLK